MKNRFLVIADRFYECLWLDAKGTHKQKYLITLPGEVLFSFAGLWSSLVNTETCEIVKSYTIATTEANPLINEIHNTKKRMPVIQTNENKSKSHNGYIVYDFTHPKLELVAKAIKYICHLHSIITDFSQ